MAIAVLLAASVARADGPAVAVDDLPPLPVAGEAPSSSATVLAASLAEEDVVTGAAKREQSLGSVASAVTLVSADRIRRFGYRTVGEALAAVAGMYLVDNRLSYSIGVRGLQIPGDFNTRILVLVDGASVNEAWGSFAGVGYDAIVSIEDIARIEVIRGPVSSVYGTNAFFGIINIVTKGAADSARAWARASLGSIHGVTTSAGFAAGRVHEQVRGSIHFMNRIGETLALEIPDGRELGFDGSRSFIGGLVGVYGGSFAQVRASHYRRESPFAPYDVNPLISPYEQFDTQVLVEGGHARELSKRLAVAGRLYANLYEFSDHSPPYDPVTGYAVDSTGTAQTFGGEIRGRYEIVAPNRLGLTAGTEASYNRTRSTAASIGDPTTPKIEIPTRYNLEAAYAELDGQPRPWLGFVGGARFDRSSALEDRVSPRAALFLGGPDVLGVKLLYAEGFRNASAYESTFEDGAEFVANRDIRAETIRTFEAVAWARPRAGLSARLSAFYWDARRIIEAVAAPADPNKLQFQNVSRYVSAGAEAEVSLRTTRGWYAFGGAAFTRVGTEGDAGAVVYGHVPSAPAITASAGLSTPKLGGVAHVSAQAVVLGPRPTRPDATGAASPEAPAWVGIDLTAYVPDLRGFDVTAGVKNLIGTRDQLPAPGDYDRSMPDVLTVSRVPGEGRELYVKVGYAY